MGRARVSMGPIADNKIRRTTFRKRVTNLQKKAFELHKLCDIDVFVICLTPEAPGPIMYPSNPSELHRIIARYIALPPSARTKHAQAPKDINKKIFQADQWLNFPVPLLNDLASDLDAKIELLGKRIMKLENENESKVPSQEMKDANAVNYTDNGMNKHQVPTMMTKQNFLARIGGAPMATESNLMKVNNEMS